MERVRKYLEVTGLGGRNSNRYLWSDAYALKVLLRYPQGHDLAHALIQEVHHTLGTHRPDDSRTGWISGLDQEQGPLHPTCGGLRIGKPLPERLPEEAPDYELEWSRDGQYYHYLTKWISALTEASELSPKYLQWAIELAQGVHSKFFSLEDKKIYWKMSIDLSRPLVSSMGLLDPLDGYLSYWHVQIRSKEPVLKKEILEISELLYGTDFATTDMLGMGILLTDMCRAVKLVELLFEDLENAHFAYQIFKEVADASLQSLRTFMVRDQATLSRPVEHRLAFRELGLVIGLFSVEETAEVVSNAKSPVLIGRKARILDTLESIKKYTVLGDQIMETWEKDESQADERWKEHEGINLAMLSMAEWMKSRR